MLTCRLGGSRHSTGALFALAHSTTAWYHGSRDESASSPSNAETITSIGPDGRPRFNQTHKHRQTYYSHCQHEILHALKTTKSQKKWYFNTDNTVKKPRKFCTMTSTINSTIQLLYTYTSLASTDIVSRIIAFKKKT